ncbi:MAG: amidase [Pseudomonadota bacterium]
MLNDPLGAFCRHDHVELKGAPAGAFAGLRLAVKDVFDIKGHVTGAGQPDWLRTHPPASSTAPVVQALLDAGADVVGKTQTDELVYSLNGENVHYGTPVNPRAPGRIPGGSSSGSAAAVAGGLADIALGTDCAGSVRLPASYTGIHGFRPTHGRVAAEGAVGLAPSFDTVGWFARDAAILERVGRVLIADAAPPRPPARVLIAEDTFALAGAAVERALQAGVEAVAAAVGKAERAIVHPPGLPELAAWFRVIQGFEVWRTHGEWITRVKPDFGPGVRERYVWAATVKEADTLAPCAARERFAARLVDLLKDDAILCLPTAPGIAPLLDTPSAELEAFRLRAIALLAIAGLARLPQASLPLGTLDDCPVGLSLVGAPGADLDLLAFARSLG